MLEARPITLRAANALVTDLHRHHASTRGWKFGVSAWEAGVLVGAVTVGRPVSREFDEQVVAEVTRLVTSGTKNACSFLYSRAARICKEMGYAKIQTYILADEPGTSLLAAGWVLEATTKGGNWDSSMEFKKQGRRQDQPQGPKKRYAKYFDDRETMKRKREQGLVKVAIDNHHITSDTTVMSKGYTPIRRRRTTPVVSHTLKPLITTINAVRAKGRGGLLDCRIEAQVDDPEERTTITVVKHGREGQGTSRDATTKPAKPPSIRPDELPLVSVLGKQSMKQSIALMQQFFANKDLMDAAEDAEEANKAIRKQLAEIARDHGLPGFRWGTLSSIDRGQKTRKSLSPKLLVANGVAADVLTMSYTESAPWDDVVVEDSSRPKKPRRRKDEEELDPTVERSEFA